MSGSGPNVAPPWSSERAMQFLVRARVVGKLRRLGRVPRRHSNIALSEAIGAAELPASVTSLPLWPWMDASVEALAVHPLEAGNSATADEQVDGT